MHLQRIVAIAAAAVGFISIFLPWGVIGMFGYYQRFNPFNIPYGTGPFAVFVLLAFIAAGVLAVLGDRNVEIQKPISYGCIGAGAVAFLFTIAEMIQLTSTFNLGLSVGGYLALVAAAVIIGNILFPFIRKFLK